MTHQFELRTLGEFAFSHAGMALPAPTTKKARALLAYLVMNRKTDVSREALLERFWPDFEPERARDNLKVSLWSVRRSIRAAKVEPADVLRGDRTILRWVAPISFDAERFAELCTETPSPERADEALALYRGDFLEGDFDEWVTLQRERLAAAYETLLSRAAASSRDVAASQTLLGRNPYDETAYATLIDADLRAGRPQAAVMLLERCRAALAEVGARPSEDFERRFGTLKRAETVGGEFRIPFVARDAELRELGRRVAEASAGMGSVSVVHGDAGIGKSSVLEQVSNTASQAGLRIVELRCKGRETQTLSEWQATYDRSTGRSFTEVVANAGAGAGAVLARDLCASLAETPTALIVDDAQYLSGESFTVLVDIVQHAAGPTCIVIASRPEGLARIRSALHGRRDLHDVRLDCLSDFDLESALRQGAGNDLSTLAHAVFERTKGHPLYVVQTVAALVENGTLARDDNRWTLRSELDESLPVSSTMRAFIEGRLTARGSVPASVASALALEPAASATELGSALGMDETTLLDALDDLLSLGLIVQPESGSPFAFSHDLVQEAAAAMLHAGRRVRIHAAFARDLVSSNDRDAALRRARHLLAAGESLAASREFLTAARRAQDAGLPSDAVLRAGEGIEALERVGSSAVRDARLAALHREIAIARSALFDFEEATRTIEVAISRARDSDADEFVECLLLRARLADITRTPRERVPIAREALECARSSGNPKHVGRALVESAAAARESGERDSALRAAIEAVETAGAAEQWDTAQRAGAELLLTCATWWDFPEALRWLSRISEAASRAGSTAQANHRNACAVLWHLLERDDEAAAELALARRSLDAVAPSRSGSDSHAASRAFNRYLMAELARAKGDGASVLGALADAQQSGEADLPARAGAFELMLIEGLLLRNAAGDAREARAIFDRLPLQTDQQSVFGLSTCVELARAGVEARERNPAASRSLRRALDTLEDHAHRTPLCADAAFSRLSAIAREIGSDVIAVRADERSLYFRAQRRGAAGSAWGGRGT